MIFKEILNSKNTKVIFQYAINGNRNLILNILKEKFIINVSHTFLKFNSKIYINNNY